MIFLHFSAMVGIFGDYFVKNSHILSYSPEFLRFLRTNSEGQRCVERAISHILSQRRSVSALVLNIPKPALTAPPSGVESAVWASGEQW